MPVCVEWNPHCVKTEVKNGHGCFMRSDAVCMLMSGSVQEEIFNPCPIYPIYQTSFPKPPGRWTACAVQLFVKPAAEPASKKKILK